MGPTPSHTAPQDTRGAQKLRAALAMYDVAFGVGRRLRGARAIDVGASTGGFTAVMLEHGAEHVVAVDVGHGQLMTSLRQDPRVELLEKTDFRRASLDVAAGPFSFFTIDVSFVAARNMLRSLAFRLEPGAHGVVLIKPQFELSKAELRSGEGVDEPKLRKRAVELVRERAERSGFRLLDARDSPVPGESGTVELIALLAFDGRPDAFPKPGEKLPAPAGKKARRERAAVVDAGELYEWFAIAAPGIEGLLAAELAALAERSSVRDVRELAGGVSFRGPLLAGYAVNLASRLATRVVLRLGAERAREFSLLRRKLHALPFERFLSPGGAVRIDVTTRHCRLYHTKAIAETVELAIADRLRAPVVRVAGKDGDAADEEAEDEPIGRESFARVLVRGVDDVFTISIDSSGELLHRRGGREEQGAAPMRETLAAAMLAHAGYTGDEPLIDAMCGSGTLAIEAAQIASGVLAGERRRFALESFAGVRAEQLAEEKERLRASLRPQRAPEVAAFDRDVRMIELARRNAERIGVAEHIAFQQVDVRDAKPPFESGLVVCNPPYGRRLGKGGDIKLLYRAIGHALRGSFGRFRVAIVVPRGTPEAALGLKISKRIALQNGGVPITLYVGTPER